MTTSLNTKTIVKAVFGLTGRAAVSTDTVAIAAVARQWGAKAPLMRPAEPAQNDDRFPV